MGLSSSEKKLLDSLKRVALEVGEGGRALTWLIGELSACKLLGLSWQSSPGYDAIGANKKRFQIKTRKSWTTVEVNPKGRLGRFGRKDRYEFDYGVYVELDKNFEVSQIFQLPRKTVMSLEAKKTKSRGLHVYEFRQLGNRVHP